ncbi:MAG: 3-isopropylmalate dehydratase large subunit [Desulfurococcales archaeon]|nr:3-isopropylmalate dehydratase large subunit [Desulfurococcales archaeon]
MEGTLTHKILSRKAGRAVSPGEIIVVDVDLAYAHDGTAPLAIKVMEESRTLMKVADPEKVALVIDHASPPPTVAAATVHRQMREFARRFGVKLFDVGEGICHQVIPESGLVKPGMVVLGADSHTVTLGAFTAFATGVGSTDIAVAFATGKTWLKVPDTVKVELQGTLEEPLMGKDVILKLIGEVTASGLTYKAVEFVGEGVRTISVASRMTISNMTVEAGAKAGIFPTDGKLISWYEERFGYSPKPIQPEDNASYEEELNLNLSNLEPQVAAPPNVDNVHPVSEVEGVEVDQVFIGSCTNGRFEDFLMAAKILKRGRVRQGVRCVAIPASRRVYIDLIRSGIAEMLANAGCVLAHSTCGPCIGAHLGLLAEGEVAVSTTNRNFTGRMGHKDSKVYLVSPATAAASAITGRLTDPREFIGGG